MILHAPDLRPGGPAVCETRQGKPDDLAFVVDCWSQRELRDGDGRRSHGELKRHCRLLLGVPNGTASAMPAVIERLLVAHVPGEPDSILGWACFERGAPGCIHYVYVRNHARELGVARALIGNVAVVEYSRAAPKFWPRKPGKAPVLFVVPATWTLNIERSVTK